MDRLDQTYINELVVRAKDGESNAFAELFMSVSDRVYIYLYFMTQNRETAQEGVREVFKEAMRSFSFLIDTGLFLPWILRRAFRYASEKGRSTETDALLARVLSLPLAESQILLMHLVQGLTIRETADMLNVSPATVKRFVKIANRHLNRDEKLGLNDISRPDGAVTLDRKMKIGAEAAARILRSIFDDLEEDPNTVPLEALASYTVYRKERFSLQRGILIFTLIVFILMPVMFLVPHYEVSLEPVGERGLPVYTIKVSSILPPSKVTATLLKHSLPVYEAGAKEFTIEPTRNGIMKLDVELLNRQFTVSEVEVTDVDHNGPELLGNTTEGDFFVIKVRDLGIGVDYKEVYAIGTSGAVYYPTSSDEEGGIIFAYPEENWDIYIPDHIGNTLHLALKLKDAEG